MRYTKSMSLMRKDERVTLLLLNQTGGLKKCDFKI